MTGGDGDGGTRARPAPPRPPPLPSVSLTYRDLPPASLAWLREALSAWQAHHLRYFGGGGEAGAGAGAAGSAASAGAPLSSGSLELLLPHLGAPRQQQRQATLPVFADVPVPAARGVDDEAEEAKGRLHPATLRPSPAASRLASRRFNEEYERAAGVVPRFDRVVVAADFNTGVGRDAAPAGDVQGAGTLVTHA